MNDDLTLAEIEALIEEGAEEAEQQFRRPCAYCGRGFIPKKNLYARYCSGSHRAMASQKRLGRR
jgi:hypothetical protein